MCLRNGNLLSLQLWDLFELQDPDVSLLHGVSLGMLSNWFWLQMGFTGFRSGESVFLLLFKLILSVKTTMPWWFL